MRYAVLGASGQLGRDLCPRLDGEVVELGRSQADLTEPGSLREALVDCRPDVVVNCAAYNLVDRAEDEPESAFAVNAMGVWSLSSLCREVGCKLAHVSTDYVFGLDAVRSEPYAEEDAPGPVSLYGVSKLAGEYAARWVERHFVIRTCGLYGLWGQGGKGKNFVETMLRVAGEGKPLRVVNDQVCTPTSTVDLAEAISSLVRTEEYGLYHFTNAGSCTWYEFASKIFSLSGVEADLASISSEEFGARARRPSYSVLSVGRYERLGLAAVRGWEEALAEYLEERQAKGGRVS